MSSDHPIGPPAELAALYVTGAMTPEERRRFDEHLAGGCALCIAAIRRLDSVAQVLSPPKQTKDFLTGIEMAKLPTAPLPGSEQAIQVVRGGESEWQNTPYNGVTMRLLNIDHARGQYTALIRMDPHAVCSEHRHDDRSQCLVLEGDLFIGEHHLLPGDFAFTGAGGLHDARAGAHGCVACVIEPLH